MTREAIEHWLAARTPNRPPALATQMSRFIAECPAAELNGATTMAAAMGALGIHAVSRVAGEREPSEGQALELLAADAFVTYAFEAAAEEGVDVMPLALHLLRAA